MRRRSVLLLLVIAIVFAAVLSYPYLGLDSASSRIPVRNGLQYSVLVTHIFAATVALVLGPLQFMPKIRARKRIHRIIGGTYLLAGVLPSALAAIPVAMWSGQILTQISLTVAAVLWLITGALAYRAARRRDFAAHRAWMMRNYALTFLAVTSRILTPLLLVTEALLGGAGSGPVAQHVTSVIPIGQTLGWIVDLIVVEILLRRTRRVRFRPGSGRTVDQVAKP
ncbi:MAG TPA: DUF2306 domain-containing protein [Pseudonocardiaceae bacterium]|nr:DUF2306 domain-containing protein [Pseudonocardiaceae bacterium]